jgi:hypothetical protein
MKKILRAELSIMLLIICTNVTSFAQGYSRTRESFNEGWKFIRYFNASTDASATIPGGLSICLMTGLSKALSAILLRITQGFFPGKGLAGTGNILQSVNRTGRGGSISISTGPWLMPEYG